MSTSYFLRRPQTPTLHIGKLSPNWTFALRVYPGGPSSLEDWIALWSAPGAAIIDDYRYIIGSDDVLSAITDNGGRTGFWTPQLLLAHNAEEGQNGLARRRFRLLPDPDGPYDLIGVGGAVRGLRDPWRFP